MSITRWTTLSVPPWVHSDTEGRWVKYTDIVDVERDNEKLLGLLEMYKTMYNDSYKSKRQAYIELGKVELELMKSDLINLILGFILLLIGMVHLYKYLF